LFVGFREFTGNKHKEWWPKYTFNAYECNGKGSKSFEHRPWECVPLQAQRHGM